MSIQWVRKRDGRLEKFQPEKIARAIHKAITATGEKDGELSKAVAEGVVSLVSQTYENKIPSVENVRDMVEEKLMQQGLAKTAKAFILYRQGHKKQQKTKQLFGVKNDLNLGINAVKILEQRYLKKNEAGQVVETPSQMFWRCAKAVAAAEKKYGTKKEEINKLKNDFYNAMARGEFLPNSPALMNAGTSRQQMAACFVLPIEDSIESVFETLKITAAVHQTGGGTGFSFSRLRPGGDFIRSTGGRASGTVSFAKIFDLTAEVIKQGGRRRGANMGILNFNHPDIIEFIEAKRDKLSLQNFNLSVAVTDDFIKKVKQNKKIKLIHPRTKKTTSEISAREILNRVAASAWETGDPGLIFIDEINRRNPLGALGKIEAVNPCGETPLYANESCVLGSINLSKIVKDQRSIVKSQPLIDWLRLEHLVKLGVRFLDNIIDVNAYPTKEIETATKSNRKIGLGVMGLAEMLISLGVPYDSAPALRTAGKVMKFISDTGRKFSSKLGKDRGTFSNFKKSVWYKNGFKSMRNATISAIAPTGTISIIAGTSSGIEPLFAIAFVRHVMEGTELLEVNKLFEKWAKENNLWDTNTLFHIASAGSLKNIKNIPEKIKKLFATALDISPEWHIKMQAIIQKYTDNAASKTINLPRKSSIRDIINAFFLAHRLKCKGITLYRYGTMPGQVLTLGLDGTAQSRIIGPEFFGLSKKECGCER